MYYKSGLESLYIIGQEILFAYIPARRACLDIGNKNIKIIKEAIPMKKKRFIATLLVLALAICVFPAAAFAEPITSEQPD